jgi:hypothetical protein
MAVAGMLLLGRVVADVATTSPAADIPRTDDRNGRVSIQDNLWSTEDEQYAVWTAPDGSPFAAKRHRGDDDWQVVNLARLPGNPLRAPTEADRHNVYVIALDSRGFVHIAGNMHNDPLRYIRSVRPRDLTSWEIGSIEGPATHVTYPAFVGLPDGTLLFWRREGVSGEGSLLLDVLAPGAPTWRHVGVIVDGRSTQESPYLHRTAVDPRSGTVHVLFTWRVGAEASTTNDLAYTRSRDGGRSWETTGGRQLALPITHADSEIVIDTPPAGSGILNGGGLTLDDRGRPHGSVMFARPGHPRSFEHVWHDGTDWRRAGLDDGVDGRPTIAGTPDGRTWLLGTDSGRIVALDVTAGSDLRRRDVAPVPLGWEVAYDTQALVRHGTVEILIPDGRRPQVVTAELD